MVSEEFMNNDTFLKMYAKALTEVEALGAAFEKEMKKIEKDFSKEYFCWMFENLLQYSLLEISWVDGKVDPREILITNKVTKYGDLLSLANSMLKTDFHWEDLIEADPEDVRKLLKGIKDLLAPMQTTFVTQFAAFDKNAVGDSLDEVIKGVTALFLMFMSVDGNVTEDEKEAAKNTYIIETLLLIAVLLKEDQ